MQKSFIALAIGASTVVEHLPHHQKRQGSSLAATGTGRDKRAKFLLHGSTGRQNMGHFFIVLAIDGSIVLEHLPLHRKSCGFKSSCYWYKEGEYGGKVL